MDEPEPNVFVLRRPCIEEASQFARNVWFSPRVMRMWAVSVQIRSNCSDAGLWFDPT